VLVNKEIFNFNTLTESLIELDRFPLLVMMNEKTDFDELIMTHNSFKNVLDKGDFSVLYRKDNTDPCNKQFNEYIQDNKLNNKLDNNPKIVYITKDKFPKTLLKTNWKPRAVIMIGSDRFFSNTKMTVYTSEFDLIIHYDSNPSPYMNGRIEKL
jgi:hypothetical protein